MAEFTNSWQCPFCNQHATLRDSDVHEDESVFSIENRYGDRFCTTSFIVCPNSACKQFTFSVKLTEAMRINHGGYIEGRFLKRWQLIPPSNAKTFPAYIPQPIRDDYQEACLIKDLSPKASATLARRCLQGMIRDFWEVKKNTLKEEIDAIKDKVDPITWRSIDAVRKIGNIGAHMEKDINLIVDVEPEEASKLIQLIELLIRDWYIVRKEREEQHEAITGIAEAKELARKPVKSVEENKMAQNIPKPPPETPQNPQ